MEWIFTLTLAASMAAPGQASSEAQFISKRVPDKAACMALMKEWEPKSKVGNQVITQKSCGPAKAVVQPKAGKYSA